MTVTIPASLRTGDSSATLVDLDGLPERSTAIVSLTKSIEYVYNKHHRLKSLKIFNMSKVTRA